MSLYWNRHDESLPWRTIMTVLPLFNLIVITLGFLTNFSLEVAVLQWSEVFEKSLVNWYIYSISLLTLMIVILAPFLYAQIRILLRPENRHYIVLGSVYIIVASAIWLPYGFENGGYREIWSIRNYLKFGPPNAITGEMIVRLSARIPFTIAHIINPEGFQGHYLIHYVAFILKSIFLFAILKKFAVNNTLAFCIALLFMVYPSNAEIMLIRSHTQILRVSMFLLAVYAFLVYRETQSRVALASFFITMFFVVTSVEHSFVVILVFPLLLMRIEQFFSHRFLRLSFLWYLLLTWYVGFYYIIDRTLINITGLGAYANNRESIAFSMESLLSVIQVNLSNFTTLLIGNWISTLSADADYLFVSLPITVLIMVIFINRLQKRLDEASYLVHLIAGGVLLIFAATSIFSVFPDYAESHFRIYFYGSIGSSIVVTTGLYLFANRILNGHYAYRIFLTIFGILFGLAYTQMLQQYGYYWERTKHKTNFTQFVGDYEKLTDNSYWIILTELGQGELEEELDVLLELDRIYHVAIEFAHGEQTVNFIYVCYLSEKNCEFNKDAASIDVSPYLPLQRIPYNEIVFFWLNDDFLPSPLDELPDSFPARARDNYRPYENIRIKSP